MTFDKVIVGWLFTALLALVAYSLRDAPTRTFARTATVLSGIASAVATLYAVMGWPLP